MYTQLRLSTTNRMVGGVAAGIAETFGWDVTLVRVGFVALSFLDGVGLLLYGALWLALRLGVTSAANGSEDSGMITPVGDRNRTLGLVLISVGALVLATVLDITIPMLAVLLIAGGWYLMRRG